MAYSITYGTSALYEAGSVERAAYDVRMSLSAYGVSTLDLKIPPSHPLASTVKVHDFAHLVDVRYKSRLLFRGFITRMDVAFDNCIAIHCESELAMLSWVTAIWSASTPATAHGMLGWCVNRFNEARDVASLADWSYYCSIGERDTSIGYPCDELGGKQAVGELPSAPTDLLTVLVDNTVSKYGCLLRVSYSDEETLPDSGGGTVPVLDGNEGGGSGGGSEPIELDGN
jgi:hypothetical protein